MPLSSAHNRPASPDERKVSQRQWWSPCYFAGGVSAKEGRCHTARQAAMAEGRPAEAAQDGRIHIEKINGPFLFRENGSPAEYMPASWPWKQEFGTYMKFTQAGANLFV